MAWRIGLKWLGGAAAIVVLMACSKPTTDGAASASPANASAQTPAPAVVVTEESFTCIRDMTPVGGFFVDNLLGDLEATVAVAESPAGKTYPPGSLVQVVPTSAMVKHQPGHNPETNDWEFIQLDNTADGTTILGRGFAELTVSGTEATCFACHEPAKAAWDLICQGGHGCLPVGLTPVMLRALQNTDQRCPTIDLPQDQIDALAALAASRAPPPEQP
jgi:hypothetical protein